MALIDSYISHEKLVSVSNVLREHNVMKEEIKKSWNFSGFNLSYWNAIHRSSCKYICFEPHSCEF